MVAVRLGVTDFLPSAAKLAGLGLRRGRDHHRGDQAGGEKVDLLHYAIPLHRQGEGDLPDDWEWIRQFVFNRSGMLCLFSGHDFRNLSRGWREVWQRPVEAKIVYGLVD